MIGGQKETFVVPKDQDAPEVIPKGEDVDLVKAFETMLSKTSLKPEEQKAFEDAGALWAGALYRLLNDPERRAEEGFSPELIAAGKNALKELGIGGVGVSVLAAVAKQASERNAAAYESQLTAARARIVKLEDRLKVLGES